tara:strand:- start:1304 stop:1546 length:243 start_codon:yes stop_codon:yes gene_type:complete
MSGNNNNNNNEGHKYDHLVNKIVRFTDWKGDEEDFLIKQNNKEERKLVVSDLDGKEYGILIYKNIGPGRAVNKIKVLEAK